MNVLLINPPMPGLYHRMGLLMPPLGVMYCASVLKEHGHEVHIMDMNVAGEDSAVDYRDFDIVGISSDTPRINEAMEFAKIAKEAGKIVVLGGVHPTFLDEELLYTGCVDYIVRGEGEATFLELVTALQEDDGHDMEKVRGISWLNEEGEVVRSPSRDFIDDLDEMPYPARDLIDLKRYKGLTLAGRPMTSILTSRGCPYDCSFCSANKLTGRTWRARRPAHIVDEMESIMEDYPFTAFCLVDDNFTLNVKRVNAICTEIIERKLDIRWWCMSRTDLIARNERLVERMAASGCDTVFLGLESGSQRSLEGYHKESSVELGKEAVRLLKKHGIDTHASFIIGDVNETHEDIRKTLNYALELNPYVVQFSIMTPYPGTSLFEKIKKRIYETDWAKYDGTHGVFRVDNFLPGELEDILRDIYKRFYLRPRRLLKILINWIKGYHMNIARVRDLFESLP